ncbi:MAG: hypothetical protein J7641_08690 [Cyanobacteria bacterium SID2]|nr:hypothetical protein [Cyanobacteria bacterium SID2]MBP0003399.1 hypothetical protein [Cyanobacteria bacterium SBC]
MFFDELQPIVKEFTAEPLAFLGGFVSGVLRLDLSQEPVKSWLGDRGFASEGPSSDSDRDDNNGSNGPQSITIE